MSASESPVVARRQLRRAIRRLREAARLTQRQVADRLEWSLSKVNRIEVGEVTISGTDLSALLRLFGSSESETADELRNYARIARTGRGWWDDPEIRPYLTPAMVDLIQLQGAATAMKAFHSTLVPGLLQTQAYTQAVLDFWKHELSDAERSARLATRMRKRGHVFDRPTPPSYLVVLDESVIGREVGGSAVMIEQLNHLLALCRDSYLEIRILPLLNVAPIAWSEPFEIVILDDSGDAVLYRESFISDEIIDNPDLLRPYERQFDQMFDRSLSAAASVRFIEAKVAALLSALDRR